MSTSRANELLQYLVNELTKMWDGQQSEVNDARQAYEICAEIVKESKYEV